LIDNKTKDRVRDETDLVQLIEDVTDSTMRASGNIYKTFCPFPDHNERTPSFTVYPDESRYTCFGCGQHGDAIDFIREYKGMDFVSSVQFLGHRLNIEVQDTGDSNQKPRRTVEIADVNAAASKFFTEQKSDVVDEFLRDRHFDPEWVRDDWGIGFSPAGELIPHLTSLGYKTSDMIEAGLARQSQHGNQVYEVFRNRMMWTIYDQLNRVAGFGARKLFEEDTHPAKFINTEATELYKKHEILFGLDKARQGIRAKKVAILSEGYTDVLAWHESGVPYAVAPCGTSITENHVKKLVRLISDEGELVVAMDGDSAGLKSMVKVLQYATQYPISVSGVLFPKDVDPDDYRKKNGDKALEDLFENRQPLIQLLIERMILSECDLANPEDVSTASTRIGKLLSNVQNPILRDQYKEWSARRLRVTADQIGALIEFKREKTAQEEDEHPEYELLALQMAYQYPESFLPYREEICGNVDLFTDREIASALEELVWLDIPEDMHEWKDQMLQAVPETLHNDMKTGLPMVLLENAQMPHQYMPQLVQRLKLDHEQREAQKHQVEHAHHSSAREALLSMDETREDV